MSGSNIPTRNHCIIQVGSTASVQEDAINAAVSSFANELKFGTYTINDASTLSDSFQIGETFKTITTAERIIQEYGEKPFYDAVTEFNSYFKNAEIQKLIVDEERYPNITKRLAAGFSFTPTEVAEFTVEYQYVPIKLNEQSQTIVPKLLNEVEDFYSNSISSGILDKFCSLMSFAFDVIDAATALRNLSLSLSLKVLIDKIKDQILSVVTRVIENVKNIIDNFSIENIIAEVTTALQENIVSRFYDIKEKALNFFSAENIENFKNKIKNMIDDVLSLFTNPSLDEIEFLIYRFCNFGFQIENGIKNLINPLTEYTDNYQSALNAITSSSNRATANAIKAGAIRVSPTQRSAVISTSSQTQSQTSDRPAQVGDFNSVTQYNEGKGDSRITFAGGALRPASTREGTKPPAWRWENTAMASRIKLMKVQKRFGQQLTVTSARRTYQEGLFLWNRDLKRNGGKPSGRVARPGSSKHEQGHAYDIYWVGYPARRKEFLEIAVSENMRGIGGYTSFVHIDEGPPRFWGSVDGVNPRG
tara:strand:+ start:6244 stop:7839 length:1596 start_codon:yes stop_codon:yes gene_type:complete